MNPIEFPWKTRPFPWIQHYRSPACRPPDEHHRHRCRSTGAAAASGSGNAKGRSSDGGGAGLPAPVENGGFS